MLAGQSGHLLLLALGQPADLILVSLSLLYQLVGPSLLLFAVQTVKLSLPLVLGLLGGSDFYQELLVVLRPRVLYQLDCLELHQFLHCLSLPAASPLLLLLARGAGLSG